jgi:hypothetical protein
MFRTIRFGVLTLLAMALAACGIGSDYDIGKELKPVTPIPEGTYVIDNDSGRKNPIVVTLRGDTYFTELTDGQGKKLPLHFHFYQIAEFDGHILQLVEPGKSHYLYVYTRVTNSRVELLDERIHDAVLPPHLADLFISETAPRDTDDNNVIKPEPVRTNKLKNGKDILFLLRALAGGKYPMGRIDFVKRVGWADRILPATSFASGC